MWAARGHAAGALGGMGAETDSLWQALQALERRLRGPAPHAERLSGIDLSISAPGVQ
jgi:hypothetical protein